MKEIELETESYLFESPEGQFRAFPFYELSADEYVIFQNGKPKYFLDLNLKEFPLIVEITNRIKQGEDIETIIYKTSRFLGLEWTTKHKTEGDEIKNSQQTEKVKLLLLEKFEDVNLDILIFSADTIETTIFFNDEEFFEKFLFKDESNFLGVESCTIDGKENFFKLLRFLFREPLESDLIYSENNKELFDISKMRNRCMTFQEFQENFELWIKISDREHSMDEYGQILGLIGHTKRSLDRKHLLLRVETRNKLPD